MLYKVIFSCRIYRAERAPLQNQLKLFKISDADINAFYHDNILDSKGKLKATNTERIINYLINLLPQDGYEEVNNDEDKDVISENSNNNSNSDINKAIFYQHLINAELRPVVLAHINTDLLFISY